MRSLIQVPTPPLVHVSWSCIKCGHVGGVARTTVPIDPNWSHDVARVMFADLRKKLVKVHQRQGCFASAEDFRIGPYTPPGGKVVGCL